MSQEPGRRRGDLLSPANCSFLYIHVSIYIYIDRWKNQAGYESYVVVHSIAKRHSVGTLARSATALRVSELILVGRRDFNAFGSHGSTSHLRFRHFHSLSDVRLFLKDRDCDICEIEITDSAVAVNQHPVKKSTAFLQGNEGAILDSRPTILNCHF